jgi:hypothetical protein
MEYLSSFLPSATTPTPVEASASLPSPPSEPLLPLSDNTTDTKEVLDPKHVIRSVNHGRTLSVKEKFEIVKDTGVRDGFYEEYFFTASPNVTGPVKVKSRFVDGKEHGVRETFDQSGTLLSSETYEHGERVKSVTETIYSAIFGSS